MNMASAKQDTISIIIPVYNVAPYLNACVDSIVRQLKDTGDTEIILVDDGSTDASSEICDSYSDEFENITVIHKENGGLSDARNTGIRAASGKWLLFVDGDDWISPHSMSAIAGIAKKSDDADLIFLQSSKVFPDGRKVDMTKNIDRRGIWNVSKEKAIEYLASLSKFPGSVCAKLIKRRVLTENAHLFEKDLLSEDIDFMTGLILICSRFDYCPQEYYCYRQNREGSITHSIREDNIDSLIAIIRKWVRLARSEFKQYDQFIFAFMCYEYAVLLGVFGLISEIDPAEKRRIWIEIKNLKFLLKYARGSHARAIAFASRMIGLRCTAFAATKYIQWKSKSHVARRFERGSSMKIFFVGDFHSNNGPAAANRAFISDLNKSEALHSTCRHPISRILEFIIKFSDVPAICLCNATRLNFFAIRAARLFGKRIFYLMHGCGSYEYEINTEQISEEITEKIVKCEQLVFSRSDKIICVSKKLMNLMREKEPAFADKFDYCFNGIDFNEIECVLKDAVPPKKLKNLIISTGGGIPQKRNLEVCAAIQRLNREDGLDLKYIVIGASLGKRELFEQYDFVRYYESLPHEDVIVLMAKSRIFVQNSIFEPFSLSAVEAMLCKCDLLLSNKIGMLDMLPSASDVDIIFDTLDIREIATKIKRILRESNSDRLTKGLDLKVFRDKIASRRLYDKLRDYCLKPKQ
jgi:glycosyltransferase involved in cell wall biosynthesis